MPNITRYNQYENMPTQMETHHCNRKRQSKILPRTELLSKQPITLLITTRVFYARDNRFQSVTTIWNYHPHTLRHLLQVSRNNFGQQQTPNNTKRCSQTPKKVFCRYAAVYDDIEWRLLESDGVWLCLLVSDVVWRRMSEEFLKGYLSAVYGRVWGLGSSEGISECPGLVWCNKRSIVE